MSPIIHERKVTTMRLSDIKAAAAENDCTVVTNRFVPRGQMIIMNPEIVGSDLAPGRRVLAVHPDEGTEDSPDYE